MHGVAGLKLSEIIQIEINVKQALALWLHELCMH